MPLSSALLVVAALVVVAAAVGVIWRARDGRRRAGGGTVDVADLGVEAGAVTLVQFSTATCARCPQVRRMLTDVADALPGVEYRDVDLTDRPELAARHRVLSTPTTFLIDENAKVTARFVGVPTRDGIEAALSRLPSLEETR